MEVSFSSAYRLSLPLRSEKASLLGADPSGLFTPEKSPVSEEAGVSSL
jgi:hypothetical protein